MPKPKRTQPPKGRRPGWGRPILLDLPDDADALLERERAKLGLDRVAFCRVAILRQLRERAA